MMADIVSKPIFRRSFLLMIFFITGILRPNIIDENSSFSIRSFSYYYNPLIDIYNPLSIKPKTLLRKSTNRYWNGHFLDATNKLRKIKKDQFPGISNDIIIFTHRYDQFDLQIPAVMKIDSYKVAALKQNAYIEFRDKFVENLTRLSSSSGGVGKSINLVKTQIGETDVELNINGNISFNGQLMLENKELITTNIKESKDWGFEVEQIQRFNIDGSIGDRWTMHIKQDSEADFSWENNLTIEYSGQENDIFQQAEAGNINLSLEGMDAVNLGGESSSLFGIKMMHQLGPIEIKSVIAREQVKKAAKTMQGGEISDGTTIKDYDFIIDRYFFIDEQFKYNFYPLDANNNHFYNPAYVMGSYEVFIKVTNVENDNIVATSYINPEDPNSYSVSGNWVRLEENIDYEINPILGYVRLNNNQNAIAIAYTTTTYDQANQSFGSDESGTGTNFKIEYDNCKANNPDSLAACDGVVNLKLIKDTYTSNPNSETWPLMFKNVYSLGASAIDQSGLEIEIRQNLSASDQPTHSSTGYSFLSIFGLDSEDENYQDVSGGDGKIDIYSSFLNLKYGELILPSYLPFAYDTESRVWEDDEGNVQELADTYWGNHYPNSEVLSDIFNVPLVDRDGDFSDSNDEGPAMYYSINSSEKIEQHEFIINVKHSSRSSTLNLGFMIVEGSEDVKLNGISLIKDVDYTIDYFSGTINFITPGATDPTADIEVTYEENEFMSFDQKLLLGSHMKYSFENNNYLAGGLFYYKQSIADEKVDIGYEPMQNFMWNLKGRYQAELDVFTRAVDKLPLIQTTEPSKFTFEGSYAEVSPNPNPLGQAFIDDFETSKRTSSLSLLRTQWNLSSVPDSLSEVSIYNRGKMVWYNPFVPLKTRDIWPEVSFSGLNEDANTWQTLWLKTYFQSDLFEKQWNGIMIPLYPSEYNQTLSKYLDIWLNADSVFAEEFQLHIDIGNISEDVNSNNKLDTEDEEVYGPGMGDGIYAEGEDIGIDGCTDSYEDGWGGCLCNNYDEAIYSSDLDGIYNNSTEFCLDGLTYEQALSMNPDTVNSNLFNVLDPNSDNWCYNIDEECDETYNYDEINGTEGNGRASGSRYPDSEDLNNNSTLDYLNNYFHISINPKATLDDIESMVETETINDDGPTGWKLFRIPLTAFEKIGTPQWEDVRTIRLWVESPNNNEVNNILGVAKVELVENEWQEQGVAKIDSLNLDTYEGFQYDPLFSVSVMNTDENVEYVTPIPIEQIQEYDEINDRYLKEQSLVLAFEENISGDQDSLGTGGIASGHVAAIKKSMTILTGDKKDSYFAYDSLKMYVYGGDPAKNNCDWCHLDSSDVQLLFRMGKDDNYYEIRQPIFSKWDNRNHLSISMDMLTKTKIPTLDNPGEELNDVGLDGCQDESENGYGGCLDSLSFAFYCENDTIFNPEENINIIICQDYLDADIDILNWDPNEDNYDEYDKPYGTEGNLKFDWLDCGIDNMCFNDINSQDEGEGDNLWNPGEIGEPPIVDYDGNNVFSNLQWYDSESELFLWEKGENTHTVCGDCDDLRIKGNPSINNIQYIMVGVINNTSQTIYGKILIDELRMVGVKKQKGRSMSINASLNFADLLTISANFGKKDGNFHKLQQRLGTGNSDESYNLNATLNPNLILPRRWGIKTPINISYSNSVATPKYHPGSDILTSTSINSSDTTFDIAEIQSINETIKLSTSFKKSTRSSNWFVKRTVDNVNINLSSIKTQKSNNQILSETTSNYEGSLSYGYTFSKENYISPFKFLKNWFVIGDILGESRYYYSPDKINTSMTLSENDKISIQRASLSETPTYSFNMVRKFGVNHKFTKSLSTNYSKQVNSNLDHMRDEYLEIIENLSPGIIKTSSEDFTNTFAPEFIEWLKPTMNYNTNYDWSNNIINDTLSTVNIKSGSNFKTSIGFSLKDLIEIIYIPENKGRSSRSSRGRGRSSSSNKSSSNKKYEIKNPFLKSILKRMHMVASQINKISMNYTYAKQIDYNNLNSEDNPTYYYRLGIIESPHEDLNDSIRYSEEGSLVGSYYKKYDNNVSVSTSVSFTKNIITGLDFNYSNSNTNQSVSPEVYNEVFSFFPIGTRGNEGLPIANWNVTWSGIEKFWIIDKVFKSISLSHSCHGEKSSTLKSGDLQTENYNLSYSPLIGITTKTHGRNPFTFKVNYNQNQTINNSGESTERNHTHNLSNTISFRKSGGFTIPIFFFRDFHIDNDLDFNITFSFEDARKLMSTIVVSDLDQFNEQSKNTSWSIRPNVTYNFTRWVNGNFYFVYGSTETKTTGKNTETDFGFTVNVKIQG